MAYVYEELSTTEIARRLRADEYAGWSYEGALALAEWVAQYAEDSGENVELDVVALRCDFCEYESLDAFNKDFHSKEEYEAGDVFESVEDLEDSTTVIPVGDTGRIIVQGF